MQPRKRYAVGSDYETYQRLVKARSDLEQRLGFVVSLSEIVRLAVSQLDLESTARLILEEKRREEAGKGGERAGADCLPREAGLPPVR